MSNIEQLKVEVQEARLRLGARQGTQKYVSASEVKGIASQDDSFYSRLLRTVTLQQFLDQFPWRVLPRPLDHTHPLVKSGDDAWSHITEEMPTWDWRGPLVEWYPQEPHPSRSRGSKLFFPRGWREPFKVSDREAQGFPRLPKARNMTSLDGDRQGPPALIRGADLAELLTPPGAANTTTLWGFNAYGSAPRPHKVKCREHVFQVHIEGVDASADFSAFLHSNRDGARPKSRVSDNLRLMKESDAFISIPDSTARQWAMDYGLLTLRGRASNGFKRLFKKRAWWTPYGVVSNLLSRLGAPSALTSHLIRLLENDFASREAFVINDAWRKRRAKGQARDPFTDDYGNLLGGYVPCAEAVSGHKPLLSLLRFNESLRAMLAEAAAEAEEAPVFGPPAESPIIHPRPYTLLDSEAEASGGEAVLKGITFGNQVVAEALKSRRLDLFPQVCKADSGSRPWADLVFKESLWEAKARAVCLIKAAIDRFSDHIGYEKVDEWLIFSELDKIVDGSRKVPGATGDPRKVPGATGNLSEESERSQFDRVYPQEFDRLIPPEMLEQKVIGQSRVDYRFTRSAGKTPVIVEPDNSIEYLNFLESLGNAEFDSTPSAPPMEQYADCPADTSIWKDLEKMYNSSHPVEMFELLSKYSILYAQWSDMYNKWLSDYPYRSRGATVRVHAISYRHLRRDRKEAQAIPVLDEKNTRSKTNTTLLDIDKALDWFDKIGAWDIPKMGLPHWRRFYTYLNKAHYIEIPAEFSRYGEGGRPRSDGYWSRAMARMIADGVPPVEALKVIHRVSPKPVRQRGLSPSMMSCKKGIQVICSVLSKRADGRAEEEPREGGLILEDYLHEEQALRGVCNAFAGDVDISDFYTPGEWQGDVEDNRSLFQQGQDAMVEAMQGQDAMQWQDAMQGQDAMMEATQGTTDESHAKTSPTVSEHNVAWLIEESIRRQARERPEESPEPGKVQEPCEQAPPTRSTYDLHNTIAESNVTVLTPEEAEKIGLTAWVEDEQSPPPKAEPEQPGMTVEPEQPGMTVETNAEAIARINLMSTQELREHLGPDAWAAMVDSADETASAEDLARQLIISGLGISQVGQTEASV